MKQVIGSGIGPELGGWSNERKASSHRKVSFFLGLVLGAFFGFVGGFVTNFILSAGLGL